MREKMIQVSIIIPIVRQKKAERCIAAIKANAGIDSSEYEIITETDTQGLGAPKMVKLLVEKTKSDNVCFLGDDTIPQKNFLKHAMAAMARLPDGWGMVGIDDNIRPRGLPKAAAHWVCSKRLLPLLGGEFFHTGYSHCWCDNELCIRAAEIGRYVFCESSFVYHDHPLSNQKIDDKYYRRVYNPNVYSADMELFKIRKNNNWKTPQGGQQ